MANKFFSDDDYENLTWQEMADKLPDKVRDMFHEEILGVALNYIYIVDKAESPIEQLMGIALQSYENEYGGFADANTYHFEQQQEISVSGKAYRVDFMIYATFQGRQYSVVIECDGHDFHEKTKQQAIKDKRRDRDLTKAGYIVLHFTGSEIYKDPFGCVREAHGVIFPFVRR